MKKNRVSRRRLLTDAGVVATGVFAGAGFVGMSSCLHREVATENPKEEINEVIKEIPEWPWSYVELDPEAVRKKGHLRTYEGGCSYGAFAAILESLREKVGFPFTQIPTEIMSYGGGGFASMRSLCGALNGAAAAITLVSDKDTYRRLVSQLGNWYASFDFPSDLSNQYGRNHSFLVSAYKSDKIITKSIANSMLCSDSISNWCKAAGLDNRSPERAERCCRLTGDVAAQAVILLNEHYAS